MTLNPFLNFCRIKSWQPCQLDGSTEELLTPRHVSDEAKSALDAGRPDVCLGLIKIAQALDLQSVDQLELKAAALSMLQRENYGINPERIEIGESETDLLNDLLDACAAWDWTPHSFNRSHETAPLAELETLLLREAEETRKNGAVELSLTLVDLALQHGCPSPWIRHSKAQALSQLQRFDLAHALWDVLIQKCNEPELASLAEKAYRASQQREKVIQSTPLLYALTNRIQQDDLKPLVLSTSDEHNDDTNLQTLILQEIATQRNQGQAQLSLDLINIAVNYGCHSLWLFHNKALTLQKLGQLEAAIGIWNGLSHYELAGFSDKVRSGLSSATQELILQRAQQEEVSGSLELAIKTLTAALLDDPNQSTIETTLKAMLRKRRHGGEVEDKTSPLEEYLDELDLNHAFLLQAEERRTKE